MIRPEMPGDGPFTSEVPPCCATPTPQAQAGDAVQFGADGETFVNEALARLRHTVSTTPGSVVSITKADACALHRALVAPLPGKDVLAAVAMALQEAMTAYADRTAGTIALMPDALADELAQAVIAVLPLPQAPARDAGAVALTPAVLADALDCFWNAAIGVAQDGQDFTATQTVGAVAQGFAAIAARLRDTHPAAASDDASIQRLLAYWQMRENACEADAAAATDAEARQFCYGKSAIYRIAQGDLRAALSSPDGLRKGEG